MTTENVKQGTRSPVFNHDLIYRVHCVTKQFIEYLESARIKFHQKIKFRQQKPLRLAKPT
ncbi:hypothetical protein PsorP6_010748 [Peronosclerospora sorghi]|uniref:Uncharacterized protein n=1 Tax=Peronosclerospora sorghi TaxID=230839 RepID=A0ACC0VVH6_9STRA|nr:hypothetical protein PsorP6_010748 [Peronosclerospora sorghi]